MDTQIIQNSTLTALFQLTGQAFWTIICIIGILTVAKNVFLGFKPKKLKGIK